MWRRKLRRAFERSGARAPGAVVGWAVVVILMLVIPATQLGLYTVGDPSEVEVEGTLAREELALGPTVTSSSEVTATDAGLDSTLTTMEPEQDLIGPTVPAETPATPLISTTAPATTAAPTSRGTTASTTTAATAGTTTTATPTTGGSTRTAPTTTTEAPTTAAPTSGGPTTAPPRTATTSTAIPTTTTTTAKPTTAPSTTQAANPNFAVGDAYQLESGDKANLRVLSNDGDQELLDPGTLEIIVAPSHAEKFGVRGNHIRYESDADHEGPDSLRYRICTIDGVCAAATVTIQVIDG